jgi:hypothetical protein
VQFVGLWTCGHMMSKKALDATAATSVSAAAAPADAAAAAPHPDESSESGGCPVCGTAFTPADVILILPPEAERESRRRLLHITITLIYCFWFCLCLFIWFCQRSCFTAQTIEI